MCVSDRPAAVGCVSAQSHISRPPALRAGAGWRAPCFYSRAVRGFQREPTSSLALKPGQCCSTGSLTAGAASGSPCPLAAPPTGAPPRRHTTIRRRIVSKLTKDIISSSPLAVMLADASAPAVSYRCAIRLTNERKKRTFSAVPTSLHLAAFVKKYIQVRQEVG